MIRPAQEHPEHTPPAPSATGLPERAATDGSRHTRSIRRNPARGWGR